MNKKTAPYLSIFPFLLLFLCLSITACGKKGIPEPTMTNELFSWRDVAALPAGNCITLSGSVVGIVTNVDSIFLELQALTPECENCPFAPEIKIEFPASNVLDLNTGVFSLNYCPNTNYDAYRWRITGKNRIYGLPLVESPMHEIFFTEE